VYKRQASRRPPPIAPFARLTICSSGRMSLVTCR